MEAIKVGIVACLRRRESLGELDWGSQMAPSKPTADQHTMVRFRRIISVFLSSLIIIIILSQGGT